MFPIPKVGQQRQIIVIEGKLAANRQVALKLTHNLHTLLLETPKKAQQYLGQEFDAVIFSAHVITPIMTSDTTHNTNNAEQFDPNAFGAISGTIRSGGYLLLLKSEKWSQHSLFLKRFDLLLRQYQNIRFIYSDATESSSLHSSFPPLAPLARRKTHTTEDQKTAVKAIIRVVKGHRRRPLLIQADRGRGKSAALGMAAAQLYQQACKNIIICAPSKKVAAIVFQYAQNTPLQFYSPDELQQQKPKADLLLIDEAAAIPVPLLTDFVKHYSRIVFATTQQGYEGSGRGFTLTFKKILDKTSPQWKSQKLTTPIRWDQNDTLEKFSFKALLLDAEAADHQLVSNATLDNIQFESISKEQLVQNDPLLNDVFGLLVSAHYQTKPSDFKQMLDDKDTRIYALRYRKHVIAVSLVIKEGSIDQALALKVFEGSRRIKGHLVAQALAANIGLPNAPCLQAQRISRIAIHPALQQKGFGTHLLHCIEKNISTDYLSTSFGASHKLLQFWRKSGFMPVYLGMKRDACSSAHSVIMLRALSEKGRKMQNEAEYSFLQSFPHLLSDPFRHLESDIAYNLLLPSNNIVLSKGEKKVINAFANGLRGYENSLFPVWKLVLKHINTETNLNRNEIDIIIIKVLQKHNWRVCSEKIKGTIHGKKAALNLLRSAILKLFQKTTE